MKYAYTFIGAHNNFVDEDRLFYLKPMAYIALVVQQSCNGRNNLPVLGAYLYGHVASPALSFTMPRFVVYILLPSFLPFVSPVPPHSLFADNPFISR